MKTLIAIPCMETVPWEFAQSLIYLQKGNDVSVLFKPNTLIYDARNLISLTAIDNNFDRVLWLDSDMVFQPDILQRLHDTMTAHDCDMVTGVYFKRAIPTHPVLYDRLEEPARGPSGYLLKQITPITTVPKDDVFPVRGCGFGCVLTSTKLLRDMWNNYGPPFTPFTWAGEDLAFCHRVNKLGYTILCDSSVYCGHVGKYVYMEQDMKRGDTN